ncbi:MAG: hypothetical protein AB1424_13565 [Thermodesulfobacteriota bacterium]
MKMLIKFLIISGLAFCLTEPSLDGTRWDSFLVVFGVLSLIFFIVPLVMDGFRSGRGQVDMGQTGAGSCVGGHRNRDDDWWPSLGLFRPFLGSSTDDDD